MVFGITLNNASVVSGESVKGSIYFNVKKEVPAQQLVAVLKGEEFSKIRYTRRVKQGDHYVTRTYYKTARRNLVQQVIPVSASNMIDAVSNKIQPGNYVIPFEVQLPQGLPSTMECHKHGSQCSISYSIRAQVKGSGWFSDYKADSKFQVRATPLSSDAVRYQGEPAENHVNGCGCVSRGYILFGASVSDTLLDRGETVRIDTSCRNRSVVDVVSVQARVIQTILWRAESKQERISQTLTTVDFGKLTGIERLNSLSLNKTNSASYDLKQMARELDDGKYSCSLTLPVGAYDTFMGSLITVRHLLHIVVTTGGCCMTDPTISIPIQAGPPRSFQPIVEVAPNAPPTEFDFGSATTASPVYVSQTSAHLGGATEQVSEEELEPDIVISGWDTNVRSATIENLLLDLKESLQDYNVIQQRSGDPDWRPIFVQMSPSNFGRLIKQVDLDFDQPKVAFAVATEIKAFSCAHVVAAVQNGSEWNKAQIVEKLLPVTSDLQQNHHKILDALSDWDKTVTERAFKEALARKA